MTDREDKGLSNSKDLDIKLINEWLSYCPISGLVYWKKDTSNIKEGSIAGRHRPDGYVSINFKGRQILAHRIAWAITYQETPRGFIDHINNDRSDNRITNIRLANRSENNRNSALRKDNKTGEKGVHYCERDKLYIAQIRVNGKPKRLGSFKAIEDAIAVRRKYEIELYGEFANHG